MNDDVTDMMLTKGRLCFVFPFYDCFLFGLLHLKSLSCLFVYFDLFVHWFIGYISSHDVLMIDEIVKCRFAKTK